MAYKNRDQAPYGYRLSIVLEQCVPGALQGEQEWVPASHQEGYHKAVSYAHNPGDMGALRQHLIERAEKHIKGQT